MSKSGLNEQELEKIISAVVGRLTQAQPSVATPRSGSAGKFPLSRSFVCYLLTARMLDDTAAASSTSGAGTLTNASLSRAPSMTPAAASVYPPDAARASYPPMPMIDIGVPWIPGTPFSNTPVPAVPTTQEFACLPPTLIFLFLGVSPCRLTNPQRALRSLGPTSYQWPQHTSSDARTTIVLGMLSFVCVPATSISS
jgi:hypothetical protein